MESRRIIALGMITIIFVAIYSGGCSPKIRVETAGVPDKPIKIEAHITIDIRQVKGDLANIEDMVSGQSKTQPKTQTKPESFWRRFSPETAYAEEISEVEQAVLRRQERFNQVKALKRHGSVGEDNQGHLYNLSDSSTIQAIVDAENVDREIIYDEQLKAKGYPQDAIVEIRKAAAELHHERADSGEKLQLPSGEWIIK